MPADARGPAENRLYLLRSLLVTAIVLVHLTELRSYIHHPAPHGIFQWLFITLDFPAVGLVIAILVLGLVPAVQSRAVGAIAWVGSHPLITATVCLAVTAPAAFLVYHRYPLSMDEYAVVFQSRVFAAGHLAARFPPELLDWLVPVELRGLFFAVSTETGRVASWYWPGMALVLTPFTWLGVPWLCNPVLGAFTMVLMHRAALAFGHDRWLAGLAVVLTVASPAVTVNAISYYSMPGHLALNLIFVLLVLRPAPSRLMLAGLVGSVALTLNNPVPHLLFALPWTLHLALRKDRRRTLPWLMAGYLPLVLLLGLGWPAYLGSLLTSSSGRSYLGVWLSHTRPVFALPNLDRLYDRLIGLAKVWLWAVPGLQVLALMGLGRGGARAPRVLLASSALALLVGYLFVAYNQGHGWGDRYFHPAWMVLPLLGIAALDPAGRRPGGAEAGRQDPRGLAGYVAGTALLSLVFATILRFAQVEAFISEHLAQLPQTMTGSAQVILINPGHGLYSIDLVENDPFLRNRPLRMQSLGERDAPMLHQMDPQLRLLARDIRGQVWGRP